MKRILFVGVLLVALQCGFAGSSVSNDQDTTRKVEELLSKMTLAEKVGQMVQYSSRWEMTGPVPDHDSHQLQFEMIRSGFCGSMLNVVGAEETRKAQELAVKNSRLGIPLIFSYDVIHGLQTMFPIPLGMAASWDPSLVKNACRVAGREAAASGLHWTFAPMVDVSRDARWGRSMEGAGEDPYLGAKIAYAAVKGFQGDDLGQLDTIAACAKHFAAYGFAESGRDYNTVIMDEGTLRETVLPPFKACVDAGVVSFMNAFNVLNGVPATGNVYLQRDILKGEWSFDGLVVSDWGSIEEMITHGVAKDEKAAARLAVIAGCDMDMESLVYLNHLKELVEEGTVPESLVDDAVRRILRVKYKLGLFDDPYRYSDAAREAAELGSVENRLAARDAARKSIVLLKNENEILPLQRSGRIAVIGPLADDKDSPLGNWRAKAISGSAVSLLEGIREAAGEAEVSYAKGCDLLGSRSAFGKKDIFSTTDRSGFDEAKSVAADADVVLLAIGENGYESGESRSKADIRLKGLQEELLDELLTVNSNIVVVLSNGRPMDISELSVKVPAILVSWQLGSESGHALADVLFGDYNPSGKLPVSFPRSVGQVPIYHSMLSTGRPVPKGSYWSHYIDCDNSPLYPFGYGLSYTSFDFSDFSIKNKQVMPGEVVEVEVTITNTGPYDGEEVVQLYIQDVAASRARPVRELKGFEKVFLKKGESKTISFTLTNQELQFWTINQKFEVEPGVFKVFVGSSSQTVLQDTFEVYPSKDANL